MRGVVLGTLALLACSGADTTPSLGNPTNPPAAQVENGIPRAAVERDLKLEVTRRTTESVDYEREAQLDVWLVNTSATASYPIVLSNDGSEVGWREPHAFFVIEGMRPSGTWEALPQDVVRCGMYARDWTTDMRILGPGERVKLQWMPYPWYGDLGDATRVRVTARYEYGEHARDKSKVPIELHPMPEYALASTPIEIPVEHPYQLTLKLKGPLPMKAGAPLAPALELMVQNRSRETLAFGNSESGGSLNFELQLANGDVGMLDVETVSAYAKEGLASNATASLVTAQTKVSAYFTAPTEKIVRVRAILRIHENKDGTHNQRRVESVWVDVK